MVPMRTLLLALFIVLLPLRGWMGDAMALQSVHSASVQAEHHAEAMHAHAMHEHAAQDDFDSFMSAEATDADEHTAHSHAPGCGDCKVCQLCHGTALSLLPGPLQLPPLPRSAPQSTQPNLSSVAIAPTHKPPIL
jgi:hypothetical protein